MATQSKTRAARTAARTKRSYLGAQYRRLAARRGAKKAILAVAHSLLVIAYHVIMGLYGFWLPNDPRGSGSDYVGSKDLYEFGPATKVTGEQSVAKSEHDLNNLLLTRNRLFCLDQMARCLVPSGSNIQVHSIML